MNLSIELDDLNLNFTVVNTPVAAMWAERMAHRHQYPLDHPDRFYGFGSLTQEQDRALSMIQNNIDTINNYRPVISRQITTVDDQDTLNYLHSIFERYHGLLDSQDHTFFANAPDDVKQSLADLNINVHRCESVARGSRPRFVCTWYGLPKTKTLSDEMLQHGTLNPTFGSVCLNYCEIGKTLEDLTQDRDNYISDDAFKPFNYYSADFNVRFYQESPQELENKLFNMRNYFNDHVKFFHSKGYNSYHEARLQPYKFPVAELVETMPREQLLKEISLRQQVTKVTLA